VMIFSAARLDATPAAAKIFCSRSLPMGRESYQSHPAGVNDRLV
jgi:hypothetical protein